MDDQSTSIGELKITELKINKLTIGKLIIGRIIQVPQENPSDVAAESPQEDQPVTDEASPETPFMENVESPKETPSADTAEREASPRSSITIDEINIGGISPQENEPFIDEASPGSLSTIVKPVQENPSMEDTESQKENPSVGTDAPFQENPSSAIVEASPGSSSPMVDTSEVVETSSEIGGFGEENPPVIGEEASPESIPEESASTVVSEPAQETPSATEVSEDIPSTEISGPAQETTPATDVASSEEIQSTEVPESSPENPPVLPEISQEDPQETPTVETAEPSVENPSEDPSGSPISNPEVSSENLSTEFAESLQENPSTDMAGTSTEYPPDGDFSFSIKPARKLRMELETYSKEEVNPSQAGRFHIDQEGFWIDILHPDDILRHAFSDDPTGVLSSGEVINHFGFNASECQDFQCSVPMGGRVIDLILWFNTLGAYEDEDTVTMYHTQGSNRIDFRVEKTAEPATENLPDDSAEPETENPSDDSAEPETENPSNNDFSFEMKPACKLKLALEVLSNTMFNPSEKGRIDVNEKGFRITVLSPSDIFGHLWLPAEGLQNFQCSNPMVGKLVDVRLLLENLQDADDQDTVTVYAQGADEICFIFGPQPTTEYFAEFIVHEEIPECPEATVFCHSILTNKDMELVREKSLDRDGEPQLVTVDMTKDAVIISVGMQKIVHHEFTKMGYVGTYGMQGDQRHIGRFYWIHAGVLKQAALLSPGCVLGFVSEPPEHVMLLFPLQQHEELGQLMFLKKANRLIPNLQEITKFQSKD